MITIRWVAFFVAFALGACFNPERPANLNCSAEGECPSGLICAADKVCRQSVADAASDAQDLPLVAAELNLEIRSVKTFRFLWSDAQSATHYKLMESADGGADFTQVATIFHWGFNSSITLFRSTPA